jgi:Flp pilus assembly protein TadD
LKRALAYLIAGAVIAATGHAQAWRGMGRMQGTVTEAGSAKAVAGAIVTLRSVKAGNVGPEVVTDKKGKWAALGLLGGTWHIDIAAEGYHTKQLAVELSEVTRMPPMKIELEPLPPPEPEPETREVVQVGGQTVGPEIAAAIELGNRYMEEQKFKEAVVEYEKAQTALQTNLPLKQALARAYYASGQLAPAVNLLRQVYEASPDEPTNALLYANLLLEDGQLEPARKVLDGIPQESLRDATVLINVGILFLNKNEPAGARDYFTRALKIDEKRAETYYYRGLAAVQQGDRAAARADFEKTIELAPESPEAAEAKEMLKALR